jgi:hypothetical protein
MKPEQIKSILKGIEKLLLEHSDIEISIDKSVPNISIDGDFLSTQIMQTFTIRSKFNFNQTNHETRTNTI